MEVRKVQLTGLKSFTITLPKPWIVQHNIQKKQPIFIKILKNGSLLLHPKAIEEDMEITTDIEIEENQNPEFLFRSLLGAYASGSNKFKIINKGQFKPEYKKKILEFVNRLDGLEIKEENLGPEDARVLIFHSTLGDIYFHQGDTGAAEREYQKALTGLEKSFK